MTEVAEMNTRIFEDERKNRLATTLLAFTMFSAGLYGLVFEYIMSTVSTYILGNSIEQFSVIIALMMLMMGVAGLLQKHIGSDRLIEKFMWVEVALAVIGGFAPLAVYAAFGIMEDHFLLVLYATVMVIGLLIGLEIPLLLRINEQYAGGLQKNLASILTWDYVGGFVGMLVWVGYLLKKFPLTEVGFVVAGFNFAIAFLTFLCFTHSERGVRRTGLLSVSFAVICILLIGYAKNRGWSDALEQKLYNEPIVFSETTKYQRLVVTHSAKTDEKRLYINGNLQFSSVDEVIYHEHLVHPVMSLAPRHDRILVLGGGDGLALREILKYPDVGSVTLVDLDPEMTRIASVDPVFQQMNHNAFHQAKVNVQQTSAVTDQGVRQVFQETGAFDKKGRAVTQSVASVHVFNLDADKFLSDITGAWDVVIIDFPDPNSIELTKLYSKEFYLKLGKMLAPGGMIAVQSTSPYHAKEAYLCIGRTLEAAKFRIIPYHDNVPSFGDWGWYVGWKSEIPTAVMRQRFQDQNELQVSTSYLTPEVMRASLAFGKSELRSSRAAINTMMQPALLELYTKESWLIE